MEKKTKLLHRIFISVFLIYGITLGWMANELYYGGYRNAIVDISIETPVFELNLSLLRLEQYSSFRTNVLIKEK